MVKMIWQQLQYNLSFSNTTNPTPQHRGV